MKSFWNWSSKVELWNTLLSAACLAVTQAAKNGAGSELINHWSRLVFKLDNGSIDHWGLLDLWSLIRQESTRQQVAYALAPAQRQFTHLLRNVYHEGWTRSL